MKNAFISSKKLFSSSKYSCVCIAVLYYLSGVKIYTFFSGIVPASEYLFSAPRGLFILVVFFPLPSIFSALLEDSKQVSFQRGFARYFLAILSTCATSPNFYDLRLFRVPAQGVEVTCVLRFNEGVFKNDVIHQ